MRKEHCTGGPRARAPVLASPHTGSVLGQAWVSPSVKQGMRIPPCPPPAGLLCTCQTYPCPTCARPTCPSVSITSARKGGEAAPSLHTAQFDSLPPEAGPGHRSVLRQTCRPSGACTQHMQMGTHAHKHTAHLHTQMCTTYQTQTHTPCCAHTAAHGPHTHTGGFM